MILVTGGAGFIDSNFVLDWLDQIGEPVVNIDNLNYAGNLKNLASVQDDGRHTLVEADIPDRVCMSALIAWYKPRTMVHFATKSYKDRPINGPTAFVDANMVGTFRLLDAGRSYWTELDSETKGEFCFLHISSDEVYGARKADDPSFTETASYRPNSPYSASKAISDHLAHAYHHTYGLPVLTAHCSNNYGPYHFPEKLIPLVIVNVLSGKSLPNYGDGQQIHGWLYIKDDYSILDELRPPSDGKSSAAQIAFGKDRPGHDRRYAIGASKIKRDLGWKPVKTSESGIRKTMQWYLENEGWITDMQSAAYRERVDKNYNLGCQ